MRSVGPEGSKHMTVIESRIRAAIERAREQSSSIPDVERLFLSLKSDFPEIGISNGDSEGERACIGLMLMTLKMLMPECKAIMEAYSRKKPAKSKSVTKVSRVTPLYRAADGTWRQEQQRRAAELIDLYTGNLTPTKEETQFLFRSGLATRADFIEALACESDSLCSADLKLWLDRLEPHWHNKPKMTVAEARALWETDQRQVPTASPESVNQP